MHCMLWLACPWPLPSIPSAAHDLATDAAIIPAIAPRRQLHHGGSIEIAMEQRVDHPGSFRRVGYWAEDEDVDSGQCLAPADKRSLLAMRKAVTWLMAAGVIICLNVSARAEDADAGKAAYLSSCATCHGGDGKGKGPHSSKLKTKPVDLTLFAKKNNGVFPLSAVYDAIDGRKAIESHGISDMPIWGCRHAPSPISPAKTRKSKGKFKVYRPPDRYESHLDLSCDSEDIIANRILSVIEYLRRIQEK